MGLQLVNSHRYRPAGPILKENLLISYYMAHYSGKFSLYRGRAPIFRNLHPVGLYSVEFTPIVAQWAYIKVNATILGPLGPFGGPLRPNISTL